MPRHKKEVTIETKEDKKTRKTSGLKFKKVVKETKKVGRPKKVNVIEKSKDNKKTTTSKVVKIEDIKNKKIEKVVDTTPKIYDTNLYILDMCLECEKTCKCKAIRGATMYRCPDTTVNMKTWKIDERRKDKTIIKMGN